MSTLRERIIAKMSIILERTGTEHQSQGVGGDRDFRPSVVSSIVRISKLKTMSPSQARKALDRVDTDVKRLKQIIENLPTLVRGPVALEVKGLDDARRLAAHETGRTVASQKRLAAGLAFDLILDHGIGVPTLTRGSPYIKLANLLFFTATGKRGNLEGNCRQHFRYLKSEELKYRRQRGRRPRRTAPLAEHLAHLKQYDTKEYVEHRRERRLAVMKEWPPLDQVVDAVLGQLEPIRPQKLASKTCID